MKIKICGITNLEDAQCAVEIGVWAVGFIFYKKSPRYIEPLKAREIISKLPSEVKKIGVFVNEDLETMLEVSNITNIDTFQLHGDEKPELCKLLTKEIIKAFRFTQESELEIINQYKEITDSFLIDAKVKNAFGGTGVLADWELAKKVKNYGNLILAGGIGSDNIAEAIKIVNPFAIDLSSSVEYSAGIKNHEKIRSLKEFV